MTVSEYLLLLDGLARFAPELALVGLVFGAKVFWRWRAVSLERANRIMAEDRLRRVRAERELSRLLRKPHKKRKR